MKAPRMHMEVQHKIVAGLYLSRAFVVEWAPETTKGDVSLSKQRVPN